MKTILVIDDEPVVRALAEVSLAGEDRVVRLAPDAATALEAIADAMPDLILLDLGLPDMRGDELARRLRADDATARIPILYLTGLPPEDEGLADGVVAKPFTPEKLRAYASNWL
ncbi:MAG TPA: response regulator [Dehalococcoidia bacterium]